MKQVTLQNTLEKLRKKRNFFAIDYLNQKIIEINKFFNVEGLNSAVIGLSGGIDSAVVYKLLIAAANEKNSPIKEIHGVFIPINTSGITGQEEAKSRVFDLFKSFCNVSKEKKHSLIEYDITEAVEKLLSMTKPENAWVSGQMACIVRTPILYGEAAKLQSKGLKSLVIGTTNRDEGSYIGFFGKASDAMVDLQPIADLHKSEVIELAKILNIPQSIIDIQPKGDVWDAKVDEEMIGAPYWFLEMYLLMKQYWSIKKQNNYQYLLSTEEREVYLKYAVAIEKIHSINSHKYKVGSPARFIDIMQRKIKGGWQ